MAEMAFRVRWKSRWITRFHRRNVRSIVVWFVVEYIVGPIKWRSLITLAISGYFWMPLDFYGFCKDTDLEQSSLCRNPSEGPFLQMK